MVSIELFFLFLQYIFIGKLEGMKKLDNQHNQKSYYGNFAMVYIFISEFNRTTNCRWRIISSYDGRNILFNAAYVFVVGISSFYKDGLGIDYQLRMGRLDLGLVYLPYLLMQRPDKINYIVHCKF